MTIFSKKVKRLTFKNFIEKYTLLNILVISHIVFNQCTISKITLNKYFKNVSSLFIWNFLHIEACCTGF